MRVSLTVTSSLSMFFLGTLYRYDAFSIWTLYPMVMACVCAAVLSAA